MRSRISLLQMFSTLKMFALGSCVFFPSLPLSLAVRVICMDPLLSDLELGFAFALFLFAGSSFSPREFVGAILGRRHRCAGFFLQSFRAALSFLLFFVPGWFRRNAGSQPTHLLAAYVLMLCNFAFLPVLSTRYRGKNRCGTKVG